MPRSRSRSRSYSRSVSTSHSSHRDKKYDRTHKSSSRYKSSRKRSRSREHHRRTSTTKHSSKYYSSSHRRHSSSRSSSRDSRRSSSSTHTDTSSSSGEKSRRREKKDVAPAVVEKVPNFASVDQLGSNISAKVFQELNEDSFAAKAFTSSGAGVKKSPSSSILIDITSNPTIQLPASLPEHPEDTVFHQNLYGNDAVRMEKWVKKLFAYRQKASGRM